MNLDITPANVELFVTKLVGWAADALPFVGAMFLLLGGLWLAGFAERSSKRLLQSSGRVDPTITLALASIIRYALIVMVLIAVLGQLGIQTISILAALSAIGLAVFTFWETSHRSPPRQTPEMLAASTAVA